MTGKSEDPPEAAGRTIGAQTLERGLDILERIVEEPTTMAAFVERSALSRTTTWRLIQALAFRRFVTVSAAGELRAGPKVLQLGAHAQNGVDLLWIARRELDALAHRTGISAFLGRRDGPFSVHLHRSAGNERIAVKTLPGTRRPLAETSLGRALLLDETPAALEGVLAAADQTRVAGDWMAGMERARADGVVFNQGPPPDCIHALAAPVRDASGRIVAAISVASPAASLTAERMPTLTGSVRETAAAISHALGFAS